MTDLQGVGRAGWRRDEKAKSNNLPTEHSRVSSMVLLLTDTQSLHLDCYQSFKGVAKKLGNVEQR